jgi:hypothetical protein
LLADRSETGHIDPSQRFGFGRDPFGALKVLRYMLAGMVTDFRTGMSLSLLFMGVSGGENPRLNGAS